MPIRSCRNSRVLLVELLAASLVLVLVVPAVHLVAWVRKDRVWRRSINRLVPRITSDLPLSFRLHPSTSYEDHT